MSDDRPLEDVVIQISDKAVIEGMERQIEQHEWKARLMREQLYELIEKVNNPMIKVYGLYNQTTNEYSYLHETIEGHAVQKAIDLITGVTRR